MAAKNKKTKKVVTRQERITKRMKVSRKATSIESELDKAPVRIADMEPQIEQAKQAAAAPKEPLGGEAPQETGQEPEQKPATGGSETPEQNAPTSYPENSPQAADNPNAQAKPEPSKTPGDQKPKEDNEGAPPEKKEPDKNQVQDTGDKAAAAGAGAGAAAGAAKKENPAEKSLQKRAMDAARRAAKWIAKKVAAAVAKLAASVGSPVIVVIGAIALIAIVIFIIIGAYWIKVGPSGRTMPIAAGPDDPNVKKIVSMIDSSDPKLEIANERDREFIKSGKIDKRLAAALAYLAERHEHIRVSHIVSGYEDIKTNTESGRFHDIKYPNNISAHKQGQAADIDEIDYVKDKCDCGEKIPVQVKWQTIGENPFIQTPDALNQIKKPEDVVSEPVKKALEKFGVKGLDQKDLIEKMRASVILSKIDSPYDLIDPNVISEFEKIGVTGLNNESLQAGLKRVQALQTLSEMDIHDINALNNPAVQDLLAKAGVPVSDELIGQLEKMKAMEILQSIDSLKDLDSPDVKVALSKVGVDANDPKFRDSLGKMIAAQTINNWQGDLSDPKIREALAVFGLETSTDMEMAMNIMQANRTTFSGSYGTLNNDVSTIKTLEQLAIFTGDPEMQKAVQQFRAAEQISNGTANWGDPQFLNTLNGIGLTNGTDDQIVVNKYQAAQMIMNYQGDYTDPRFQNALSQLGVNYNTDDQEAINKYKAAQTLSRAASGELAPESQEVKDALKTIGASSMLDEKAKAAVNVGNAKNPNDPSLNTDKNKIGLNKATYQDALGKLGAAKNLTKVNEYSDLNDPAIQKDLERLGLKDPKYYDSLQKVGALGGLTQIHDLEDLNNPGVQNSLKQLGLDDPKLASNIGKLGSLQTLSQIHDLQDLNSPMVKTALNNLGVKNAAVYNNLGKLGSIDTLLSIKSPEDLINPRVIGALANLGVNVADMQGPLSQVGSIMALTQVKQPADLLQPGNLAALDTLGVIDLNAGMLGQIGAIQTLMQVDSIGDLMNPSSILALNTLGIISLSNPVTATLMAVVFLDNLMGGKLLGGIFGGDDCKATTACYKPTAQENIYKVVEELLKMPYDLGDKEFYRVTQLIVYKLDYIRSKDPTLDQKLDELYWTPRAKNVGLFTMPEAFGNIHIGY